MRRTRWWFLEAVVCLLAAAAVSAPAAAGPPPAPAVDFDARDRLAWRNLAFLTGGGADPVCLLDETVCRVVYTGGRMRQFIWRTVHIAVPVASRAEKYANVKISFGAGEKVGVLEAWVRTRTGATHIVRERDIREASQFPDFVFYSDLKAKVFVLPGVEDSCLIGYRCQVESEGLFLFGEHDFQLDIPVLNSRFRFEVPRRFLTPTELPFQWSQKYITRHVKIKPVTEAVFVENEPYVAFTWELKDVEALGDEPARPPRGAVVPAVAFAPGIWTSGSPLNWKTIAGWYEQLVGDATRNPGMEMERLVPKLIAGAKSDEEKIERIYCYVRDRIRYVSIAIGAGHYVPAPAQTTLRNRYGDCKDMSTLLVAMLRLAGIPAHAVLVRTRDEGPLDAGLPSPVVFNHVITRAVAGGHAYWLDATAKGAPFGTAPPAVQGVRALVASRDMEEVLWETPTSRAGDNRRLRRVALSGLDARSVTAVGRATWSGALRFEPDREEAEGRVREWLAGAEGLEVTLLGAATQVRADPGAGEAEGDEARPDREPDHLDAAFRANLGAMPRTGRSVTVPMSVLRPAGMLAAIPAAEERRYPVDFIFPRQEIDEIRISLPQGSSVRAPGDTVIATPFGSFEVRTVADAASVTLVRAVTVSTPLIPVEDYPALRSALLAMARHYRDDVIVVELPATGDR